MHAYTNMPSRDIMENAYDVFQGLSIESRAREFFADASASVTRIYIILVRMDRMIRGIDTLRVHKKKEGKHARFINIPK